MPAHPTENVYIFMLSGFIALAYLYAEGYTIVRFLLGLYVHLGPVVQSIVSLTSSLVVKMLTVLVSTISNSQLFLLKKCE